MECLYACMQGEATSSPGTTADLPHPLDCPCMPALNMTGIQGQGDYRDKPAKPRYSRGFGCPGITRVGRRPAGIQGCRVSTCRYTGIATPGLRQRAATACIPGVRARRFFGAAAGGHRPAGRRVCSTRRVVSGVRGCPVLDLRCSEPASARRRRRFACSPHDHRLSRTTGTTVSTQPGIQGHGGGECHHGGVALRHARWASPGTSLGGHAGIQGEAGRRRGRMLHPLAGRSQHLSL